MTQPILPSSPEHISLLAEEELNEARLAVLMNDASIDQILALDTGLKITAWNRACEQATGIPRKKAIGRTFTEVATKVPEFPHIIEALANALKGFKSFVPWEKGGYGLGYFEHHFIPLKSGGEVVGILIVIHDVAHRIKAEEELQRLNRSLAQKAKQLQQKTEELANFNWIASHDLKEPLRKIYTFIEMVATKEGAKISDSARSNLRRAQSAVQRMGLLTDDIVIFSQVTAPSEQLTNVNLEDALQKAIALQAKIIDETSAIITADKLPDITAYPDMLQLLVSHMLANAVKFHREGAQLKVNIGYAHVAGTILPAMPDPDTNAYYHCLTFTDNGLGFAPEFHEKIFGMFKRLHPQGTYKGTGMGLPICRKVAEAHEGLISVQSEEGVGSTFSCYLKDFDGQI